jgi:hypothetical protein
MDNFRVYFSLGREHILDYANGYDHILFVVALCAIYQFRDWKRVLVLVTAFTVGHSITLALATLNIIHVKTELIEFLIPLTIFITSVTNIFRKEENFSRRLIQTNYLLALGFGLIHGMGFSNYLRAILGKNQNLLSPLFAFNVGLEVGQIIIVLLFLSLCFIFVDLFGVSRRDWKMVISSAIAGISLVLMKDAMYW